MKGLIDGLCAGFVEGGLAVESQVTASMSIPLLRQASHIAHLVAYIQYFIFVEMVFSCEGIECS